LKYIRVGGQEAVRQIYGAVRDRNWGTVEPVLSPYEIEDNGSRFRVSFRAEHVNSEADFVWDGLITGEEDGTITFSFKGTARKDFFRNRIGFCVLHPMELAGIPVEVETARGTVQGVFPRSMSPHQPFMNMRSIRYEPGEGGLINISFEGDLFEMEDQRMWTDASYKTYCTPLDQPFPVLVRSGETVEQKVILRITGHDGGIHGQILGIPAESTGTAESLTASVDFCSIGTLPPIGLNLMADTPPLQSDQVGLVRALNLAHLRAEISVHTREWSDVWHRISTQAVLLGVPLELEVVCGSTGEGLKQLFERITQDRAEVKRLHVYAAGEHVSTCALQEQAARLLRETGLQTELCGGTRAYFTQLNRAKQQLPSSLMDGVHYCLNPQVHACDLATLIESLPVQALTVANAKDIFGDLPVHVGPVTLKPRYQPTATGATIAPREGDRPFNSDARQSTLFAAGWTIGSLFQLGSAGAASMTYYETAGLRGVMPAYDAASSHVVYPLYHVLAAVGEFAGAELLHVSLRDSNKLALLALRKRHKLRVLAASFGYQAIEAQLQLPAVSHTRIRYLDEFTASDALRQPGDFAKMFQETSAKPATGITLRLSPFAVAFIDAELILSQPCEERSDLEICPFYNAK
jgi:hypothetical protein